jgi:hypothetical protein
VAEPRVVDGLEHHHAPPPARAAGRRRVPRQRAQLQVVPAGAAAARRELSAQIEAEVLLHRIEGNRGADEEVRSTHQ